MRNTYIPGNRVVIIKNCYSIRRNDVLVFRYENQNVIKRCVGLPGDTIKIIKGVIYSNNEAILPPQKSIIKTKSEIDVITMANISYTYGKDWTPYNMGPYTVPKKGMKVYLTPETISLYESIIKRDSSKSISVENENEKRSYVFQHNYFFLVGDNRIESTDSRVFGPINESDIKGKAIFNF